MTMKFESFNLKKETIKALHTLGYEEATKVQDITIPKILKGENVIIKSETGSGKTHAFLVPIINNLKFDSGVEALIIVPTNELALQTYDFFKEFKEYFPSLAIKLIINGIGLKKGEQQLKTNSQVIIATPTRLSYVLEDSSINLENCKTLVLDEADMLSESGFFDDVQSVLNKLNKPQVIVLSATISQFIRDFLRKNLPNDLILEENSDSLKEKITHYFINTKHLDILDSIDIFLNKINPYLLFIFANTKKEVNDIYLHLKKNKYAVGTISGELSLRERKAMLRRANNNDFQILVCSDLAARGIDVEDVSDVLSVNIPNNIEYYFHRAGRTARNGKSGNSYVFYNHDSLDKIRELLNLGVEPNYLKITNKELVIDQKPDISKRKSYIDKELANEINKATAKIKKKEVKPNYKKKVKLETEKVKRKYKRKMIKKEIRKELDKKFRSEGRRNG